MKVYAFVPAKSRSSRVPHKNMRILAGERLFIRALKILLRCKEIDKVILDSDSEEMFNMVDYLPVTFMKRDVAFSDNSTDGHSLFMNELRNFPDADIYVQLLCTSPFILPDTIDSAILKLKNNCYYDSAILIKQEKLYIWKDNEPIYGYGKIPNSFELDYTISESMGLYIHKHDSALATSRRYGSKPYFILAKPFETVDINQPEDFDYAETVALGLKYREAQWFTSIKNSLNSALISDLMDDMKAENGIECGAVISGFKLNLQNTRILGRASTLKIRKLKQNEDFRDIYRALESYDSVTFNDIICVENEEGTFAYFGDLNARLAIRAGASAAIINGMTRDTRTTTDLNFPVFCLGENPVDIRRRATLDYIEKPIHFGKVMISPGDLIFADGQGIVIIYPQYEKEILERALLAHKNEANIIDDITNGEHTTAICAKRGPF